MLAGLQGGLLLRSLPHPVFNARRTRPEVIGLLDKSIGEVSQKLPAIWIGTAQDLGDSSIEGTEEIIVANLGWQCTGGGTLSHRWQ